MPLSRRLARPLLSSIFVAGGLDALLHPDSKVPAADKVLAAVPVPADHVEVIRANGAVQVGAGLLLATGRFRRMAAVALAISLIPTTLAGHRFWEETDPAAQAGQRVHFFKNLSILGGLLLAAVDTEGSPSLGYRARRRAAEVGDLATSVLPG